MQCYGWQIKYKRTWNLQFGQCPVAFAVAVVVAVVGLAFIHTTQSNEMSIILGSNQLRWHGDGLAWHVGQSVGQGPI